jgi:tetratricopeptide (TPR) repeat protein
MTSLSALLAVLHSDTDLWYGFTEHHGWVVWNKTASFIYPRDVRHIVRCKDWAEFQVPATEFNGPDYVWFEHYVAHLPDESCRVDALMTLLRLREQYAERFFPALAARIKKSRIDPKEAEAEARREFARLKRKYSAESFSDDSPACHLFIILHRLEANEFLDEDLNWLKARYLHDTVIRYCEKAAHYYEEEYRVSRDPWAAIDASSYWRDADQPERALVATEGLFESLPASNYKARAAVLTTRGGAYRDLGRLDMAEELGLKAIEINDERHYPYMLLGAVYYDKGYPEKGDEFFRMAIDRGEKPEAVDAEIRAAVEGAEKEQQKRDAEYLLKQDPKKYAWAKRYL